MFLATSLPYPVHYIHPLGGKTASFHRFCFFFVLLVTRGVCSALRPRGICTINFTFCFFSFFAEISGAYVDTGVRTFNYFLSKRKPNGVGTLVRAQRKRWWERNELFS